MGWQDSINFCNIFWTQDCLVLAHKLIAMELEDFFRALEGVTKMVSRLDIKFQNVDSYGVETPFQTFIKKLKKWNKIVL